MTGKVTLVWLVAIAAVILDGLTVQWGGYFNLVVGVLLVMGLPIVTSWAHRVENRD